MSMQARMMSGLATILAMAIVAFAVMIAVNAPDVGLGPVRPRGGAEEALEQDITTQLRLENLREARADGTFGQPERIVSQPAAGWAGERVLNIQKDDWEPAIATDRNAPFVYTLVTRYAPRPCPGCASPFITFTRSADGGATWGSGKPLCPCRGRGQFDPIIEVVPDTGDVYAVYMKWFRVVFTRSTDHGLTWSRPVPTFGQVAWGDKPVLATSDDGRDVYVSFNGPTGGDPWIVQSHDFGTTWTQTKVVDSGRYFFAFDADVTPGGKVVFSQSSIDYSGPDGAPVGKVLHHAIVSSDQGASWTNVVVDRVAIGKECIADGCSPDFYIGHTAVAATANDDLIYLYDGAIHHLGPQRIFARRSPDGGLTWTGRERLSRWRRHASIPAVESVGGGDVRAWYAETGRRSQDSWKIWYLSSTDGGLTWSSPVKISDASSGAGYKTAAGFLEIYGDYGEVAITSAGKTIGIWGEGFSWTGPGGVWFNRQT
jgi:hypothetical protein